MKLPFDYNDLSWYLECRDLTIEDFINWSNEKKQCQNEYWEELTRNYPNLVK